jgi:pimeloyl-ACP methyl ester carboxylesterase
LEIYQLNLVGNDSGGGVAQIFASLYPERVRSLTVTILVPGRVRFVRMVHALTTKVTSLRFGFEASRVAKQLRLT